MVTRPGCVAARSISSGLRGVDPAGSRSGSAGRQRAVDEGRDERRTARPSRGQAPEGLVEQHPQLHVGRRSAHLKPPCRRRHGVAELPGGQPHHQMESPWTPRPTGGPGWPRCSTPVAIASGTPWGSAGAFAGHQPAPRSRRSGERDARAFRASPNSSSMLPPRCRPRKQHAWGCRGGIVDGAGGRGGVGRGRPRGGQRRGEAGRGGGRAAPVGWSPGPGRGVGGSPAGVAGAG